MSEMASFNIKMSSLSYYLEVVLSLLIESFKISRSNKDVYWRTQGIALPFVRDDTMDHPKLPLIFERVA